MGSQRLTDLSLDIRSGDRVPAAQTHISFTRYRRVVDESSVSVYPKALATFSATRNKLLQLGSAPAFAFALYALLTASVMTASYKGMHS